ncbi:MAG TPA: hypothetical protein VJU60_13900 [Thermoleophilaceae bacterium]|nr:hypothetical protein [Thermoleophilaceae bacterium]
MKLSRHSVTAIAAAMALAASASPALARGGGGGTGGGGGGGGTTASPAPTPTNDWTLCSEFATPIGVFPTAPDGSSLLVNELGGIGCLVAKNSGGLLSIYEVRSGAGWVPSIKSSDPNKLDVQWTWPGDGTRHEITVQPGKTVIR